MATENTNANPKESHGLPVMTFIIGGFVLALLGLLALGVAWYRTKGDNAKLVIQLKELEARQLRNELERKKADEDAKLTRARNSQNEVASHARNATNILERLRQEMDQTKAAAVALKSSDAGKAVALHPDLVSQARRLYEVEIPGLASAEDINSKLEAARRIDQQITASMGTTYEPDSSFSTTAQGAALWAEQERQKVKQAQNLVSALIQESKVKVSSATVTATSPTLEAAVTQLAQAEAAFRTRLMVDKTSSAEAVGATNRAEAKAQEILAQAKIDSEKILAEAKAKAAEFQRQRDLKEASDKIETAKVKVAVQTSEDEARKVELRKKASNPEVQAKLAPFTTPGVWRQSGWTVDKKPHSFAELQSRGALDRSIEGLKTLNYIATAPVDKYRPRWKLPKGNTTSWPKYPESREMVEGAQQLLIELGPVLVEMGMLDP